MEAWNIGRGGLGEERTIDFQNNFCFSTVSVIAFFNALSDRQHFLVKCFFLPFILVEYTPSPSVRPCRALHNHTKTANAGPALTCKGGCKLGTVSSVLRS
jgi:hypothetical protein